MPTIYAHQKPNYRLYSWARGRMYEIDEQLRQLALERGLMETIAADCKAKHCPECDGEGIVMKPIKGCECDGPRQHTCDLCGGTGGVGPSGEPHPKPLKGAAFREWQQHPLYPKGSTDAAALTNFDAGYRRGMEDAVGVDASGGGEQP